MNPRRRVVVTGRGVVSAIGNDCEAFWQALVSGTRGFSLIEPPNPDLAFTKLALVTDFDPATRFESRLHQGLDRNAQFALAAAEEAIGDSGLVFGEGLGARTGVITGSGIGGSLTMDAAYERLYRQGKRRTSPMTVPNIMPSSGASHISMAHGLRGPSFTISSACASSTHAIGIGLSLIREGSADVIVAGGHESQLNHASLYAWDALRVVSPTSCRPFSRERDGMILGEGGAMLVLESLEHALGRGARIYAELAGFGMTADAHHLTAPSVEGPVSAMRIALADAGVGPEGIDYLNAHGTGTESNDLNEARAIHEVFGARAREIAVGSTKSMHGHALGAAGAIEAVATLLAMQHGILPPTPGADPLDPDIALNVPSDGARPLVIRAAMSNSFAFGGLNAVLVFRQPDAVG
jgi:nodulation protein E